MKRVANLMTTGQSQIRVRQGYTDADTYGQGFLFSATGHLDAPDWIPQGSVRIHNTIKHSPTQSRYLRDHANADIGYGFDDAAPATLHLQPGMCR